MLTTYIEAAMQHAQYEQLPDDGTYFGSIPEIQGPWANEPTLADCQKDLRSALEDWILFSVANHCDIPAIDGI
jgi:predicted RNase H-like HicB family nuclease